MALEILNGARIKGQLTIVGSTPGLGKVLTSDADGNATWQTPGGVDGSGTSGRAARWLNSTTLTDSALRDDGTRLAVGAIIQPGIMFYATQGAGSPTIQGHNTFQTTINLTAVAGTTTSAGSGYLGTFRNGVRTGVFGEEGTYGDGSTNWAGYFQGRVYADKIAINALVPDANLHVKGTFKVDSMTETTNEFSLFDNPNAYNVIRYDGLNKRLILVEGGVEGLVGVGTSTPTAVLHVVNSFRYVDGNQGVNKVLMSDANGNASWQVFQASNWLINGSHIYRAGTGNVGIGSAASYVSSPVAKLTVESQENNAVLLHRYSSTVGHVTGLLLKVYGGTADTFAKGGIFFERTGSGGIGKIVFCTTTSTGTGNVGLTDAKLTILPSGNVGIGTNTPVASFHLVGGMRYVDGNQASGKVLVSDANGNATWGTTSAGALLQTTGFIGGRYYMNNLHNRVMGLTTASVAADTLYLMPFVVAGNENFQIDQIGINVTTAATSGTFSAKIAVYNSTDGWPYRKLDEVTVTGLNTTGSKLASLSRTFTKGYLYFLAIHTGCSFSMRSLTAASQLMLGLSSSNGTTAHNCIQKTLSWGTALPSSWIFNPNELSTSAALQVVMRATVSGQAPTTPTGLSVIEVAPGLAVEASWNSVSEASSYLVEHRVNSGLVTQVEVYSESWYNYPPYNVGDYVEVRVAAKNAYGTSAFTSWSGTYVYGT